MNQFHVTIRRSGPGGTDSHFESYEIPVAEGEILSVLNVLEYIYRELDPTLAFFDHAACRPGCLRQVHGEAGRGGQAGLQGDRP